MATDSTGRIYVADLFNHRIQYFNFTGGDEGGWGTQGAGTGQFGLPVDVAVGPDDTVYVVDYSNHRVQEFARPTGAGAPAQMASWGTQDSAAGQFLNPESIAVAGHQHYVADGGNDRIQVFTTPGPQTGIGGSVTEQEPVRPSTAPRSLCCAPTTSPWLPVPSPMPPVTTQWRCRRVRTSSM